MSKIARHSEKHHGYQGVFGKGLGKGKYLAFSLNSCLIV